MTADSRSSLVCPSCQTSAKADAKFCDRCGTELTTQPASAYSGETNRQAPASGKRSSQRRWILLVVAVVAVGAAATILVTRNAKSSYDNLNDLYAAMTEGGFRRQDDWPQMSPGDYCNVSSPDLPVIPKEGALPTENQDYTLWIEADVEELDESVRALEEQGHTGFVVIGGNWYVHLLDARLEQDREMGETLARDLAAALDGRVVDLEEATS